MKIREIIMELGPVQHQNYTRIDSTPYEVKSKVNKRDYNFAPSMQELKDNFIGK